MITLGAPLALLALTTLVIPLAIHLIRKPLPTVRLGSLKFLSGAQRRLRSIRWRDLWLLAVRCGLLAALALFLAAPRWVPAGEKPVRWVLQIPGEPLDEVADRRLQELKADGYRLRYLAPGFPTELPGGPAGMTDAWSLMREADLSLPAGSEWVVLAPPRMVYFVGERPVLRRLRVTWFPSAAAGRGLNPDQEAQPTVDPIPTAPLRVAVIASPDREQDARILRAAFAALAATNRPIVESTADPDWIFQLGSSPLPAVWHDRVRAGATLITDGAAETELTDARSFPVDGRAFPLLRRAALPPLADRDEAAIMVDSFGEPLAAVSRIGEGRHIRFGLRFHPAATSWVLDPAFPHWWAGQMPGARPLALTQALADPAQIEPRTEIGPVGPPPQPRPDAVDLRGLVWLFAVLLVVLERWLAHRPDRSGGEVSA